MDLDLATDLKSLKPLIDAIAVEGFDLSTGSRMLPESKVERSLRRNIISKSYNFLVRHMLGSKVKDHPLVLKLSKEKLFWVCLARCRRRIGSGTRKFL